MYVFHMKDTSQNTSKLTDEFNGLLIVFWILKASDTTGSKKKHTNSPLF